MGIFEKLRQKGKNAALSADKTEAIIKIVETIACGNSDLIKQVHELVENPQQYFETHQDAYIERGIEVCSAPTENIVWLGMVDILKQYNYVCERDYTDEKEDFIYFLSSLNGVKQNTLGLNEDLLEEDSDLNEWCAVIDSEWENDGYCVGCIDIESDSFILFPANIAEIDRLNQLAELVGYQIKYAKEA